jgi:hypothetical protein
MKICEAAQIVKQGRGFLYMFHNGKPQESKHKVRERVDRLLYFDERYGESPFEPDLEDLTSNDWAIGIFDSATSFKAAIEIVKSGIQMKRLMTGKKLDLDGNYTIDDIETHDWVIDDPELERLIQETAE